MDPIQEYPSDFKKWFNDTPEDFLELLINYLSSSLIQVKEEASRSVFV